MGKKWDRLWKKIRPICASCGAPYNSEGCACEEPDWRVDGEPLEDAIEALLGRSKVVQQAKAMQQWHEGWLRECFRILKPGGIIKVFAATRTMHRLATAMEAVGFVLDPETSLEAWAQGQGFPKSLDVSKAIDKTLGGDAAARFNGYGTALKPAFEPFVVGRKP